MKKATKKLQLGQLSNKLGQWSRLEDAIVPQKGWINAVRTSFGMSMRQMAMRINKSTSAIQKLEKSEAKGKITLQSLRDAAKAFDMKLVYGLVPREGTLEGIIERRAKELAIEIVKRTNRTMVLEDQKVSDKRLKREVHELTKELIDEMPRILWD